MAVNASWPSAAADDHEKPDLCIAILVDFLTDDPVPTFAPVRRA